MLRSWPLLAIALVLLPSAARAADWLQCTLAPLGDAPSLAAPSEEGVTRASGARLRKNGPTFQLQGDAIMRRPQRSISADRIRFNRQRNHAEAHGNVTLRQDMPELTLQGQSGEVALDSGAFSLDDARYRAGSMHAQGTATRVDRDDDGVSRFDQATYSTCPRDDEDWRLNADHIRLNPNNRQGTAYNAWLQFQGVPFLYTPWFRFPLGDQRLTGLLAPDFSSSDSTGFAFGIPFYWNIAPEFDATLEPRYLSKRGSQLRSEVRWLGPLGHWRLNNEWLPGDRIYDDDRSLTRIEQKGSYGYGFSSRIKAATVSDKRYFEDLGSDLSVSSKTHLRRRADLNWSGAPGRAQVRVEDYQTIDSSIPGSNRPYAQLPQITFEGDQRNGPIETDYATEAVRFERDGRDTGTRYNVNPSVTWNLQAPGWFLRPRVALDYTAYDLERETSTGPDHPQRTLPILSLDSGLVFERLGSSYRQTLEPRLFYVHVPEESQDDLPVFDTNRYEFSFARLFEERRFNGVDRVADQDRLSLALTTRLLARKSGRELLRASIGASRYFSDRTVQLPGDPTRTRRDSDVAGEFAVQPTAAWRTSLNLRYNPRDDRVSEGSVVSRYDGPGNRAINVGYRYRYNDRRVQGNNGVNYRDRRILELAAAWPLSPHWDGIAGTRYSLEENRNFETLAGVRYKSCCWAVRVVARQYANARTRDGNDDSEPEQERSVSLELVLRGLGGFGTGADNLFDRDILGATR